MALQLVEKNILANLFARAWSGIIALVLIPVYLQYLGVEAYGMVGVFISLQAMVALLDLGMGATISREFARKYEMGSQDQYLPDLLRTMESLYCGIAVLIALIIYLLSPLIAKEWLTPKTLSPEVVTSTVVLLGITIAVQWPSSLYAGGMSGLQKQVRLGGLISSFATLRYVGAVAVLHFIESSIQLFFLWQCLVGLIQTVVMRQSLWALMGVKNYRGSFKPLIMLPLWRFASGMIGIVVLGTIVTQLDKIILSKRLDLDDFGVYSVATAVSASLYLVVGPIFNGFYPRFSMQFEKRDIRAIIESFHHGNQIISTMLFPILWLVIVYSSDIMTHWTGDPALGMQLGALVVPLVIGNTINGLMNVPYAVQLAAGWTRIPLYTNFVGVIFLVPGFWFGTEYFGALGAAYTWVLFNVIYLFVTLILMRRLIFKNEMYNWVLKDIGAPLLVAFLFMYGSGSLVDDQVSIIFLLALLITGFFLCVLTAPTVRAPVLGLAEKVFKLG